MSNIVAQSLLHVDPSIDQQRWKRVSKIVASLALPLLIFNWCTFSTGPALVNVDPASCQTCLTAPTLCSAMNRAVVDLNTPGQKQVGFSDHIANARRNGALILIDPRYFPSWSVFGVNARWLALQLRQALHISLVEIAPLPSEMLCDYSHATSFVFTNRPFRSICGREVFVQMEQFSSHWFQAIIAESDKGIPIIDFSDITGNHLKAAGFQSIVILPLLALPTPSGPMGPLQWGDPSPVHAASRKDIAIFFVGSRTPRRQHIVDRLRSAGLTVTWHYERYGVWRYENGSKATVLLNVHARDPDATCELSRLTDYASAFPHFIAVVSETCTGGVDHVLGLAGVMLVEYGRILEAIVSIRQTNLLNCCTRRAASSLKHLAQDCVWSSFGEITMDKG